MERKGKALSQFMHAGVHALLFVFGTLQFTEVPCNNALTLY